MGSCVGFMGRGVQGSVVVACVGGWSYFRSKGTGFEHRCPARCCFATQVLNDMRVYSQHYCLDEIVSFIRSREYAFILGDRHSMEAHAQHIGLSNMQINSSSTLASAKEKKAEAKVVSVDNIQGNI